MKSPNKTFAICVALLLGACAGTTLKAPPAPTTQLKVATWNLEHLAAADGEGCRPRTEADYAALRAYADRLAADVIAIEEVENLQAAQRVFTPDKYEVLMSGRPQSQRHSPCKADEPNGQTIHQQDVGLVIRKGLAVQRHPDLSELAVGNPDLRWGVDASVQYGANRIRLLAVHLKSGCFDGDSGPACPVLLEQVPVLQQWVAARVAEGGAFAIVGDWNRHLDVSGDRVWNALQSHDPGAGLADATAGHHPTCDSRYSEFIDHLVFNRAAFERMAANSFEEFTYDGPGVEHPSDHCPLAVVLH